MQRKKATDFPQELLNIEIFCEHGLKAGMLTSRFEPRSKELVGLCFSKHDRCEVTREGASDNNA